MLAKTNKSVGPIDVFTQFSGKLQRGTLASSKKLHTIIWLWI